MREREREFQEREAKKKKKSLDPAVHNALSQIEHILIWKYQFFFFFLFLGIY